MSPDADMDDLALLDDVKSTRSTYTAKPVLQEDGKDETVAAPGGSLGFLNASPLLEALVNWVEGPPNRPQPKKNLNEKPNPILEIPFQFIALLTYPEPDPKTGDKMSLASMFVSHGLLLYLICNVVGRLTQTHFYISNNVSGERDGICEAEAEDADDVDGIYPYRALL